MRRREQELHQRRVLVHGVEVAVDARARECIRALRPNVIEPGLEGARAEDVEALVAHVPERLRARAEDDEVAQRKRRGDRQIPTLEALAVHSTASTAKQKSRR